MFITLPLLMYFPKALMYFVFCLPGEIAVYHPLSNFRYESLLLDVSANQFQKLRHLNLCCYAEQDKQDKPKEEQTLNNSWNCGGNSCANFTCKSVWTHSDNESNWIMGVMKCRNHGRSKRLFSVCVL
ncbi:hypothetical protein HID58_087898 [Brassica napus]|uniref:Uncharacterized protein n=3 Tax=Brassica TaxID=3705 RepID=A0ABQ7XUL5_BRANA|nr:hypothetical protein HID58_087898 [Brassica napus]CDY28635.1 BnaC09g32400D [Brassica napus]VDD32206.1 unnamed protein product [Brassica oleracea]